MSWEMDDDEKGEQACKLRAKGKGTAQLAAVAYDDQK
jgi:hypothetical protein